MATEKRPDFGTDDIECIACGRSIRPIHWLAHARTHNPSAYTEGWPCTCRPGALCARHKDRRYPDDYERVTI